ncbi:Polyadenylate-binding protein RBP47C [Forsythia ovata]|uniref:Polyadenylate-binding protein RBP47C n=1 Tax=Forsythia ovata TaxID=205694 RepID=A0ABD1P4X8_9LAMI
MDEDYLRSCFASTGEVASIKVIRNKQTGFSEGYGFVEFFTHAAAEKVLQNYFCISMPNTDQLFRLNWATFSMGDKRTNNGSDLSIFVGDLAADVTDTLLHETFASKFPSVKAAKVVIDASTGRSKGYGFVRFGDDNERSQAMTEMNGVYCSSRPMRIGAATPRKSSGYQQQYSSQGGYSNGVSAQGSQPDGDTLNTTSRADFGNQWTGAYYGGPFYDGYGYAVPPHHDPSMYAAAAYGAYPVYGTHQQQVS